MNIGMDPDVVEQVEVLRDKAIRVNKPFHKFSVTVDIDIGESLSKVVEIIIYIFYTLKIRHFEYDIEVMIAPPPAIHQTDQGNCFKRLVNKIFEQKKSKTAQTVLIVVRRKDKKILALSKKTLQTLAPSVKLTTTAALKDHTMVLNTIDSVLGKQRCGPRRKRNAPEYQTVKTFNMVEVVKTRDKIIEFDACGRKVLKTLNKIAHPHLESPKEIEVPKPDDRDKVLPAAKKMLVIPVKKDRNDHLWLLGRPKTNARLVSTDTDKEMSENILRALIGPGEWDKLEQSP